MGGSGCLCLVHQPISPPWSSSFVYPRSCLALAAVTRPFSRVCMRGSKGFDCMVEGVLGGESVSRLLWEWEMVWHNSMYHLSCMDVCDFVYCWPLFPAHPAFRSPGSLSQSVQSRQSSAQDRTCHKRRRTIVSSSPRRLGISWRVVALVSHSQKASRSRWAWLSARSLL